MSRLLALFTFAWGLGFAVPAFADGAIVCTQKSTGACQGRQFCCYRGSLSEGVAYCENLGCQRAGTASCPVAGCIPICGQRPQSAAVEPAEAEALMCRAPAATDDAATDDAA